MSSRKCPHCHIRLDGNPKYCPECGAPLAGQSVSRQKRAVSAPTSRRDWLIMLSVVIVVTVAYFMLRDQTAPNSPGDSSVGSGMTAADLNPAMLDQLPDDYNTLVSMANRFMDEKNFAVAAEIYRRALAKDNSDPNVGADYGACLYGMGMPERAIEEFQKVLAVDPSHALVRFNLGIVYMGIEQRDSAATYFQEYLKVDPNGRASQAARQYLKQLGR